MKKTPFAGLTILEPGDSLDTDSGAFAGVDRETIDRLLHVGAKTHRHDGSNGLTSPSAPPGAAITASAGTIPAGLDISVGYTLEDATGGETTLSPVVTVSTRGAVEAPQAAPSAAADYTGGALLVNTYFYATTFTDGEGGETPLGPAVSLERAPGFASGRVHLSALSFGMAAAGGKGWRLYRAIGGGSYCLLATGTADTFTDDGTISAQCDVHPPAGEENTTVGVSTLIVTLPSGGLQGAPFINLYVSVTGDFSGGSFVAQYPLASAGRTVVFADIDPTATRPPSVNLSIGGAHQIDPDTELIAWHWKRPVTNVGELPAGEEGDVRMVSSFSTPTAYVFHNGKWEIWQAGGSGTVGPWTNMTSGLNSPWVGTKSPEWPPSYRVVGDRVELAGAVASGANGSTIFTLPPEARPKANLRLGFGEGVSNAGITLEVKTTGAIVAINTQSAISYLTGLSFPLGAPPP